MNGACGQVGGNRVNYTELWREKCLGKVIIGGPKREGTTLRWIELGNACVQWWVTDLGMLKRLILQQLGSQLALFFIDPIEIQLHMDVEIITI